MIINEIIRIRYISFRIVSHYSQKMLFKNSKLIQFFFAFVQTTNIKCIDPELLESIRHRTMCAFFSSKIPNEVLQNLRRTCTCNGRQFPDMVSPYKSEHLPISHNVNTKFQFTMKISVHYEILWCKNKSEVNRLL